MKDKDYDYMIRRLCDTDVSRIYVTRIDSDRGLDEKDIIREFSKYNPAMEMSDVREAFAQAVRDRRERDVLFCVGSLYLIGELKQEVSPC